MTLLDLLDTLAARLVAYAAALAALGWLVRKGWKLLRKIDNILRVAQAIMAEMKPNGGNSMRDAVNDVRTKLDAHLTEHAKATTVVNVGQTSTAPPAG